VVENLRLADGTLFPMPVTLDVSQKEIDTIGLEPGARVALLDPRDDQALAILVIEDIYSFDRVREAINVLGADDIAHPSVAYLRKRVKDFYVGGKLQAIQLPTHFDYVALRCMGSLPLLPHQLSALLDRYPIRASCSFQKTRLA
jgi:sulfate adenylyltransferase